MHNFANLIWPDPFLVVKGAGHQTSSAFIYFIADLHKAWLTIMQYFGTLGFSHPLIKCFQISFLEGIAWHSKCIFWAVKLDERAVSYTNGRFSSGKTSNRQLFGHIYTHTHTNRCNQTHNPAAHRVTSNLMVPHNILDKMPPLNCHFLEINAMQI